MTTKRTKVERIVDGITATRYEPRPCIQKDRRYIARRYRFWKRQTNSKGLIYPFENAHKLALMDFINSIIK